MPAAIIPLGYEPDDWSRCPFLFIIAV